MQIDKKTLRHIIAGVLTAVVLYWLFMDTERVATLLRNLWRLIAPFAIGSAIAFVFNVPMRSVERRLLWIPNLGLRRTAAILLTLVIFSLAIAFIVLLLIPQIKLTVESIVATLPDFVKREAKNVVAFLDANPQVKQWVLDYTELEDIDWASMLQKFVSFAGETMTKLFDRAFSAIGNVTNGIVNAFLSIAFAFYGLSSKEVLARQGRKLLYSLLPETACDEIIRILRLMNSTFSNFISGQCLEACILGGLFAVAMLLFGMPYIPLVSVIIAVTALVPLVGAFVGCILGAFFILVDSPVQALTFVVLFLVLQQVEGNLIYPRVVGTSIGLPGMWVLVALSVGGELMGVGGMLVMIPLTSVVYALLREYTQKQLSQRGIPSEKLKDHPPELKSRFKENRERKRAQKLLKRMKSLAHTHDKKKEE